MVSTDSRAEAPGDIQAEATAGRRAELSAALGRLGVWSFGLQVHPAAAEQAAVTAYEDLGAKVTWIPESVGSKEIFAHASILLAGSRTMTVASGIANIYARDATAMVNGARALAEAYPGRFVLGLGVSHAPSVATRGGDYGKPIAAMTAYLDGMAAAAQLGPGPATPVPLILAALGPRMLELAAARTDGAHSYFVPVEHTAMARERLGASGFLAVEQTAVIDPDRTRARDVARAFCQRYLALPNYRNGLRRLGWTDADMDHGGTDRLIDAVVAQGPLEATIERVRAHLDAGADHVCVQIRSSNPGELAVDGYRELFAVLQSRT
jgi:probable F420-dependent oxidoreductase